MALMKYIRSHSKCSSDSTKAAEELMLVKEKVFQNPLILQVILKHVLQEGNTKGKKSNEKGNGTLYTQNAKRLRLVSRAWLVETNLQFRKSGQPLMFLTPNNFQKFLDSTSKEGNNWIPPLKLSLSLATFSFNCISSPRTRTRMGISSRWSLAALVLLRSDIMEEMRVLKLYIISKNNLLDKEDLHMLPRCLRQASSSLEELELGNGWAIFKRNRDLKVLLNFPRMAKLKKMKIHGKIWRPDNNSMENDMESRLAKVEDMEFQEISGDIFFGEWCHNSVFRNVSSLTLHLIIDIGGDTPLRSFRFTKEDIEKIFRTFPRVVHLQLGVLHPQEMGGLRYMFGHIAQLRSLKLNFIGAIVSKDEIDGLLIGAEPEVVGRLKDDSGLWDSFLNGDLREAGIYRSSIRDLKILESLVLQGHISMNNGGMRRRVEYLPSELAFELGFMQLPSLDRLVLNGSFGVVSEEMADKWCKQKEGRKLEFIKKKPVRGRSWWWVSWTCEMCCHMLALYLFDCIRDWVGFTAWATHTENTTWQEHQFKCLVNFVMHILFSLILRCIRDVARRLDA